MPLFCPTRQTAVWDAQRETRKALIRHARATLHGVVFDIFSGAAGGSNFCAGDGRLGHRTCKPAVPVTWVRSSCAAKSLDRRAFRCDQIYPFGARRGTFSAPPRYHAMAEDLSFRRKPLTPEQRQARDASRRIEAEKAMRDHEAAQKAFYDNRERLRAERLAREAAAPKS